MNVFRVSCALAIVVSAISVCADDGWMPMNGSAFAFGEKHPTVQMVSEVVRATIHKKSSTVTCDFVFRNDGPACSVRMGFPNGGEQDDELESKDLDHHVLTGFRSSVDGKAVATKHVVLKSPTDLSLYHGITQWEVKTVVFKKGQTLHVRDNYTAPHGVSNYSDDSVSHFYYVLATGGSWKGNIERADVFVTIDASLMPKPPDLRSVDSFGGDAIYSEKMEAELKKSHSAVFFDGPGEVAVKGRTVTFTKKNWSPTDDDNIVFTFGLRPLKGR